MTKVKLCGLSDINHIQAANKIMPEYIGFVFYKKSIRYITPEKAKQLKALLNPEIKAVGVFVNEDISLVREYLKEGIIDIAQLHGSEGNDYIEKLKKDTGKSVIKAFCISDKNDIIEAEDCSADLLLLDSGMGSGKIFDWDIISDIKRPYFLAGGLNIENVVRVIEKLEPYAVDVSSGIETNGKKDIIKMAEFTAAVRKEQS